MDLFDHGGVYKEYRERFGDLIVYNSALIGRAFKIRASVNVTGEWGKIKQLSLIWLSAHTSVYICIFGVSKTRFFSMANSVVVVVFPLF